MDAKNFSLEKPNLNIGLVTEIFTPEVNGVAMTLGRLVNGLACNNHRATVYRPAQARESKAPIEEIVNEVPMPGLPLPGYSEMHFGQPAGSNAQALLQACTIYFSRTPPGVGRGKVWPFPA